MPGTSWKWIRYEAAKSTGTVMGVPHGEGWMLGTKKTTQVNGHPVQFTQRDSPCHLAFREKITHSI